MDDPLERYNRQIMIDGFGEEGQVARVLGQAGAVSGADIGL